MADGGPAHRRWRRTLRPASSSEQLRQAARNGAGAWSAHASFTFPVLTRYQEERADRKPIRRDEEAVNEGLSGPLELRLLTHSGHRLAAPLCRDYGARLRFRLEAARDITGNRTVRQEFWTMLRGSLTALVTPFENGGRSTRKPFAPSSTGRSRKARSGLVPVGTTGESPTLSHDEHRQVVKACVEVAKGRVPVIAGAGSNNTRRGGRPGAICREGRRRRGAGRHALLQQADPARPLSRISRRSPRRPSCRSSSTTSRRAR